MMHLKIRYFNFIMKNRNIKTKTKTKIAIRLPISLAQLKAGSNTEKLKNGIRQLLYSFYYSKKLTKTTYNKLINTI